MLEEIMEKYIINYDDRTVEIGIGQNRGPYKYDMHIFENITYTDGSYKNIKTRPGIDINEAYSQLRESYDANFDVYLKNKNEDN